jgi:hypothetical protein
MGIGFGVPAPGQSVGALLVELPYEIAGRLGGRRPNAENGKQQKQGNDQRTMIHAGRIPKNALAALIWRKAVGRGLA